MNKENNKFIKNCIAEALLFLMKKKSFKNISITEIAEKAGVSRMAYYRNYNYKEDILNDYMNDIIEEYKEKKDNQGDSLYSRFLLSYEFFREHKDFVISMEKSNLSVIIQNKINNYMKNFYPNSDKDPNQKYKLYMLSGALYNSAKMWIMNGLKEAPEELAKIFVNRMFKEKFTN